MRVAEMTKEGQIAALLEQCFKLRADICPHMEDGYFTVTVPPPWNLSNQLAALEVQNKIEEWSRQYPNVVCYCFDSFSTLLYVL